MIAVGLIVSLTFVAVGCVWLSFSAETLDAIAESLGFPESQLWTPPIPDCKILGKTMTNVTVGVVFTTATLGVTLAVGKCLRLFKRMKAGTC